ncbi:MAG: hypothetical protein CVT64_02885 [Actinobacteria bacterium HGW-Actinobacteria-4]|nr:MAG: hypothetical protein CVT64_02885 [Actinobacteria bacterium HGW-Actinobacteria-4]
MARGFSYAAGASDEVEAARQPELDKATLQAMGQSKNAYVREIIAGRSDCPLGLMVTLAHDYVPDVRTAVAGNASALQSVMEYLARDKHAGVVEALVANPAVPHHVLADLAAHKRKEIRDAAVSRLRAFEAGPGVVEDHAIPELRDRVFDERKAELAARDAADRTSAPFLPVEPPTHAPTPTRTAPVRGFRAPDEARL